MAEESKKEEELQEDFSIESLLFKGRVWKEYKIGSIKFIFRSLLSKEIEQINNIPQTGINATTYSLRYLAMAIKKFGNEDWENLPFENKIEYDNNNNPIPPKSRSRLDLVRELPYPLTDKMLELLDNFRLEVSKLLNSDIKKK